MTQRELILLSPYDFPGLWRKDAPSGDLTLAEIVHAPGYLQALGRVRPAEGLVQIDEGVVASSIEIVLSTATVGSAGEITIFVGTFFRSTGPPAAPQPGCVATRNSIQRGQRSMDMARKQTSRDRSDRDRLRADLRLAACEAFSMLVSLTCSMHLPTAGDKHPGVTGDDCRKRHTSQADGAGPASCPARLALTALPHVA